MSDLIDYIEFTRKPTQADSELIYEHATLPTFQLASYFEALLHPNPDTEHVKAFAEEVIARAREEKLRMHRETMQRQMEHISREEWSMIVD